MNKTLNVLRIALALVLVSLTFFSVPQAQATGTKVGLVTDGGVDDMSFNYMAYQGLQQAETELGIVGTLYETTGSDEYELRLKECVDDGNALCFAVGFGMAEITLTMANGNPGTKFAILDYAYDSPPANLRGIRFTEKEAGYLAGALAGKMTSTNTVGVVGGMNVVPAVVDFVEGYRNGAQCVKRGTTVLIKYAGTFTDPSVGATLAANLISKNADVIFAAAGPTGNGAILYSAQHDVYSIGVDADQYLSVFGNGTVDGSDMLLTSAMKRLDKAVYQTIEDLLGGTFTSGTVVYDLASGGVGLAPYHETDTVIPQAVKDYVNAVKQDIIDGHININNTCKVRTTFTSTAAQDGWVLETAENSKVGGTLNATAATLRLGDDAARKQYRSILSFNTGGLPNTAVLTKVTLKVKKQGVTGGGDPLAMFQGFKVDIKTGTLGTAVLEPADFQTTMGIHTYGPFLISPVGGWYSLNLTAGKAYINKLATAGGLTQMRLYFKLDDNNNTAANYLSLYSGNATTAADRPQLVIEYYLP